MKVNDFVNKAIDVAKNYKTLYVMGCFGAPMTDKNKKRYTTNHNYNKQAARTKMINNASSDTFGFDCVCLIKGILWGWNGNKNHVYGGATYKSNGVADMGSDSIITSTYCSYVSSDFSNIVAGEIVWLSGHVGIYIGNGQVVECTPAWSNDVQITKLSQRKWLKHGKLKYVDYSNSSVTPTNDFFGGKGYFKYGDSHENIGKIAEFMYKTFPLYTNKKALGNYYGQYIKASITEFQRRAKADGNYNDAVDGCVGPITLASLRKYGFKY